MILVFRKPANLAIKILVRVNKGWHTVQPEWTQWGSLVKTEYGTPRKEKKEPNQ